MRVDEHFAVEDAPGLFAGRRLCLADRTSLGCPRRGVHAVRAGPVLDECLRSTFVDRPLRTHRPQRDFLALLNLGDGRALGGKWGLAARGRWVWRLKDRIDRRFMERFQVLGRDGALATEFPTPEAMGMEEMACGGCAAKVGPRPLTRAAGSAGSRGTRRAGGDGACRARMMPQRYEPPAAIWSSPPLTVFGRSWTTRGGFGRVAAVNAVSDVFAKAGRPRHALALVTVPDEGEAREEETLYQVLAGIRAALDPLGISLIGGHSTVGPELFVGLSISGDSTGSLMPIGSLREGDQLVLTAPLGTGVILAADMQGRAHGSWLTQTLRHMAATNQNASEVARHFSARAATDISGFGLAGHLSEMLDEAKLAATLQLSALPSLPGARELLEQGLRSHFHDQNAEIRRRISWLGWRGGSRGRTPLRSPDLRRSADRVPSAATESRSRCAPPRG